MSGAPKKRIARSKTPAWLGAVAAASLVAGLAWKWYSASGSPSAASSASVTAKPVLRKARKGGPKSSITLSCSILPPAWLVAALHEHFNVHLLFPSPAPFVLPSDYLPSSFDARRVIFHEKGEGAVHVARVLGGMLIVVRGLEGEELPASDRADGTDEVEIGKLVRDVRSFVSDIVVVRASEGDVDGAKVVEGWTALAALLGLEGGGLPL